MSNKSGILRNESVEIGLLDAAMLITIALSFFTSNPLEGAFAIAQLKLILHLCWRKGTPPVALLLFLIPWIEISTGILEANLQGLSLNAMLHGTGRKAYWLSALGLTAVLVGFNWIFRKLDLPYGLSLRQEAAKFSLHKLILIYFSVGPILAVIKSFIPYGSGFYQIITYLNEIADLVFLLICLRQGVTGEKSRLFVIFTLIVLILSFYSLFSSWKFVAFGLFMGYGTVTNLSRKVVFRVLLLGFLFGNLVFLWQGIKGEYRQFITGSEGKGSLVTQGVVVDRAAALSKFSQLTLEFYSQNKTEASVDNELLYSTLRRAGYLEFFALTLNRVPEVIPHQQGQLLQESMTFALIPRFLNPSKGIKDDGAKTFKFTGFHVSENSSFSLGHYTEYFIDFGNWGMILLLFLYGIIGGNLYRFVHSRSIRFTSSLTAVALVYVCLDQWGSFQSDTIYLYGQTFFGTICHVLLFIPAYRVIERLAKTSLEDE